ncbi:sugar transferase [Ornithinimicrobium pekingense]|uniref:Exopolysaccharide biosynthesis polyprenyl glycosylphosphotransferase n=1 Tax=Ornithinimicrobium pekingense TaxID=384677 RepID=A0ABQ2F990_9MICO|nr:sugar transferase [Ornithinimicrobium pekingense]GGK71202.1 exopolysaccharide biosynthesis polyprenyl glycosylphosphotransferase [Ornithinimicrobium pekingense]
MSAGNNSTGLCTTFFTVPEAWPDTRAQGSARTRRYLDGYLQAVRLGDLVAVLAAVAGAHLLRFGTERGAALEGFRPVGYVVVSTLLVLGWMASLHLQRSYDGRVVGHGVQEYRAAFQACTWLFAALAIAGFALRLDFARGYVLVAFPLGTVLVLLNRWSARRWLVGQRQRGRFCDRVLLVGGRAQVGELVVSLGRTPEAGYHVVGACVDDAGTDAVAGVPVVGRELDVLVRATELDVDVVAVSSTAGIGAAGLRRLGWALEGTGMDLVVAPGIMDVAGPRVLTRPVQGLPLIHVEAPALSGPQRVAKQVTDRVAAVLILLLLLPVLVAVALCVKVEDRGPVLFRQVRVGHDGRSFGMWKFRSMVTDAEAQLPRLQLLSEGAGPLFKLRSDPRVTRTGAVIRKYSLDELPQLLNVLTGDMSLVGPRPPLPREVAAYEPATFRRLLVRPGMTGLWQVSGRSDLPWEEAVRLDLYYVENWTPVLDLMILWRTLRVVLRPARSGAY